MVENEVVQEETANNRCLKPGTKLVACSMSITEYWGESPPRPVGKAGA